MESKLMSMADAVSQYIHDGDLVFEGGFMIRMPHAIVNEIVRQKKKDLTLCGCGGWGEEVDVLVEAGCVKKLMSTYFGLYSVGLSRVATRAVNEGKVVFEDYTNMSAPFRILAGALGMPFVAVKEALGTDLLTYADPEQVKVGECPFTGEKYVLYKALNPDVAIIHVHQADEEGNSQIYGLIGGDDWGARASNKVIISAEKIVSREEIGKDPNRTCIPEDFVTAVVHAPYGAHPSGISGCYKEDLMFRRMYGRVAKTKEGLSEYMKEWIYGPTDREMYLKKYVETFGQEALDSIGVEPIYTPPINIGAY